MRFPCPNKISCPGGGDTEFDTPIANLTSEQPDHFIDPGFNFGPLDAGGGTPPLGSTWTALGCAAVCESQVSQEEADLCAQQQASECTWNTWTQPGTGSPGGAPGTPLQVYRNRLAQCSATCPDGSLFTWTVIAGLFSALSQALADRMAQSFACQKVATHYFCLGTLASTATVGTPYASTALITGPGAGPFLVELIAGTIPPGLLMSGAAHSVTLAGTPTTAGTYNFTLRATDQGGNFIVKNYTITVTGVVVTGYQLCNLSGVLANFNLSTLWAASALPAWNGVFDKTITSGGGHPIWYFTGQSFNGKKVAADETPDYPNAGWQDTDCYMQLIYDGANWTIGMMSTNCVAAFAVYVGPATLADPTGVYTRLFPANNCPTTLQIVASGASGCCDSTVDYRSSPGNCALRIADYQDNQLQNCAICGANAGPAWDGTFDTFQNFGNPNLAQFTYSGAATSVSGFIIGQGPKLNYSPGQNRWVMQIYCKNLGPVQTLWEGLGPIGTSPIGVYNDDGNGCALVKPASFLVECYHK